MTIYENIFLEDIHHTVVIIQSTLVIKRLSLYKTHLSSNGCQYTKHIFHTASEVLLFHYSMGRVADGQLIPFHSVSILPRNFKMMCE